GVRTLRQSLLVSRGSFAHPQWLRSNWRSARRRMRSVLPVGCVLEVTDAGERNPFTASADEEEFVTEDETAADRRANACLGLLTLCFEGVVFLEGHRLISGSCGGSEIGWGCFVAAC